MKLIESNLREVDKIYTSIFFLGKYEGKDAILEMRGVKLYIHTIKGEKIEIN